MHYLRTGKGFLLVVLCASLAAASCSKKDDGGKPSAVPAMDPTAMPPPAAPAAPAVPAPAAGEAAKPGAAKPGTAKPGESITGKIVLPPAQAKLKPKGTMFLVARRPSDNPAVRGTLVAVKKLPATTFPLAFELSAADMPFQNGAFEGEMTLSVRIDQDNDPMSRQKGDLFGVLPKVQVGSKDVVLSLDQVQTEAESLAQPNAHGPMGGGAAPPGHPR